MRQQEGSAQEGAENENAANAQWSQQMPTAGTLTRRGCRRSRGRVAGVYQALLLSKSS